MSTIEPAREADDVAIIGIALRFPGAETLEELGGHLIAGRSLISEVPPERWSKERYFGDPKRGAQKTNSIWGGFVEHADRFDAEFFRISPREAESMDPQQRMALELAWRVIENAGYAASDLAGTETGVFMGVCHADYAEMMEREGAKTDAYFPTGTAYSIIANRISYHFDFQGPSITNDTACSSSLVSVYEAVRALDNGECGLALAGGVNLIWSPKHFVAFSQASMLSRTGRASAFDESADGYVRGEGGAVLLLKPLAQAVADGDPIHAVIKGVATNHGGRTNSLTVTNPTAQANLIERLYTRAGIRPETVTYIEAHGPGTPVGDPIEIMALKSAFRNLHAAQGTVAQPSSCGIGSIKTNIGHLEGAAGVAGIVKVIASLAHRVLPATVNFRNQNRLISFEDSPFHVVRDTQPWAAPPAGKDGRIPPRRAGVSSFGFGGTNAHVVLEEHLADDAVRESPHRGPRLVPLSAKTPERLRAVAGNLLSHLREHPSQALADIAYTLQTGREPMPARVAFLVADRAELDHLIAEFADGAGAEGEVHLGAAVRGSDEDVAELRTTGTDWVRGGAVDWSERLGHGGPPARPRRVRLPGYPFARERHWFKAPPKDDDAGATPRAVSEQAVSGQAVSGQAVSEQAVSEQAAGAGPVPHPLLHTDVSGPAGQRYSSTFTGEEPFLASHRVRGTRVLPAAAQVEMVRAAAVRAAEGATGRAAGTPGVVRLRNVGWSRPVVVRDAPADVGVGLTPQDGGAIAFEITTGTASDVVHSSGLVEIGGPGQPDRLDLTTLLAACPGERRPADVYAEFHDQGLEYGPAMRGLKELRLGTGELIARVGEPADASGNAGYVLPPSVLDAAFQSSVVLLAETSRGTAGGRRGPVLPFAFEELAVHGPCAPETWAWVRRREGHGALDMFDIDLCDSEGIVSVSLRGLVQRTTPAEPGHRVGAATVTASPSWVRAPLDVPDDGAAAVPSVRGYLGGQAAQHAAAVADLTGFTVARLPDVGPGRVADGVGAVSDLAFTDVTDVVRSKPKGAHRFVVLVEDRLPRHYHAPLTGLFRSVVRENPRVSGRVVRVAELDTAPPERIAEILRAEAADRSSDCDIRYGADGTRHASRPVELHLGEGAEIPPLKEGGVYWITGGLGGLGRHVARYFGRCAGVTVVLSGRSEAGAASEAALRELRDAGVDAHYVPVDVGSRDDVERAVRAVTRDHGTIDGIVHAAGVLRDAYLFTKDASDLRTVLEPKVDGVLHLDAATRGLALDFFVAFSSVAGVFGNSGQSDYAAANAFLDAFAHHRQALVDIGERTGRTCAVSWPLWADGGMSMDAVTLKSIRRERGWEPLPTEDGLRVLGRVLRDAPAHVVVAYGAAATLTVAAPPPEPAVTSPVVTETAPAVTDEELTERTTALLRRVVGEALHRDPGTLDETVNLIEYGIDSLAILDTTAALEELFGPLPKTIFFEYTDIEGVAGYFVAEHPDRLRAIVGAEDPPSATAEPAAGEKAPDDPQTATAPAPPAPATGKATAPATGTTTDRATPRDRRDATGARDDYHDIAIIGVSGTYPGADTLDELWSVLEEGRHEFREVPRERWDHDAVYSRDRSVLGKSSIRTGTFLQDIDRFDPRYFRISQREAETMSPEVRLFLQTGVEALEDAGYSRETLQREYDGDVGVLVGSMSNHYGLYGFQNGLTRGSPASGSYTGTLPNMLSYFYGFTGPSMFVDTMCSGSSTCVHQAVQMLRARECSMAVAGGVNLLLHPYNLISSSQEHFTTATSDVIRSFGLGADGTILGEGIGALVLKPLVEAERDGDHVYAVIKGTALANAGVRNGFTVPSPRMQARAIEKAIDDAGVDPRTISYVEAHGSGTSLGDPIEVKALTTAFQKYTRETGFCAIGSVKSNMGHLLHAAGMIGIAKVVLQFQKGKLAPSLHSSVTNPDIDFSRTPFRLQQQLAAWEPAVTTVDGREVTHPRRAGITSIGAGGMNSHIILEEYPDPDPHPYTDGGARAGASDGREELFVFSGMNDTALTAWLTRFRAYLATGTAPDLASVAHTLRVGKNELPRRWAFLARTTEEAVAAVDRYLAGDRDLAAALASGGSRTRDLRDPATTWVGGKSVVWPAPKGPRTPRRVSLPAYPFERVRCWVAQEDGAPSVIAPLSQREKLHPFLGRNESDVDGLRYVLDVHLDDLLDYGFTSGERHDRTRGIVPTFAVDLAVAAAKVSGFSDGSVVRDLRLLGPVAWTTAARLVTVFDATGAATGGKTASGAVYAEDASGKRTAVASFDVRADEGGPILPSGHPRAKPFVGVLPGALVPEPPDPLSPAGFLAELAEGGVGYTPELSGVEGAYRLRDGRLALRISTPELQRDHVKPRVTLAPHVLAAVAQGLQFEARRTGVPQWARTAPHRIDEIRLFTDGSGACAPVAYAVFDVTADGEGLGGSVGLLDRNGEVVGVLADLWCGDDEGPREDPDVSARAVDKTGERNGAMPGEDGGDLLSFAVDELRGLAAGILKFERDELDPHTGFDAFGFDSISLIALSKQASERLGIEVTPAVFFDSNTFASLGGHLVTEHEIALRAAYERSLPPDRPGIPEVAAPEVAAPEVVAPEAVAPGVAALDVVATGARRPDRRNSATRIAVIGAAGRFPGAPDLDAYWANLAAGTDHVTAFPLDRYDAAYARIVEASDFPRHAAVLDDVDAFDAAFFRILPREAELMDPQHRLALQTAWNAVEHSGYAPSGLPRDTGLFFGVSGTDYATLLAAHGTPPDAFTSTGNAHSMLANRISYVLDIHGPSEPVDTACSSSLVAVHRAVEAIRSGACDVAIAGGVNLLLSVDTFVSAGQAGMLSPDGRCKTFASDANGYVRGEGVGAVVLKPLADAERDGDAILAVIVGSAENHGGRANSLTAPNGAAQSELVVRAMDGIDPRTIGYVEAHGTGTALGDPVEVRALQTAFRQLGSDGSGTCGLGSVKANIGHLEAAAGIAGLLKVVLAMQHGTLPPARNCDEINPYIQLDGSPFRIVHASEPWERFRDRRGAPVPRRAGVSSFGFGGANCHVVIEEYAGRTEEDAGEGEGHAGTDLETGPTRDLGRSEGRVAVPISARTQRELRERARGLLAHLEDAPRPGSLRSIGWTLQVGREAMAERVGWVVTSRRELASRLREFVEGAAAGPQHGAGPDPDGLTDAIARWNGGAEVEWRQLYGSAGSGVPKRTHLPAYPFARDRYWIPGSAGKADRTAEPAPAPAVEPASAVEPAPAPAVEPAPAVGTTLLVPRWTAKPAAPDPGGATPYTRHAVVLCGTPASLRDDIERRLPGARCHTVTTAKQRPETRFTDLSRQVFAIVQALAGEAHDGATLVQVVTPAGQDEEAGPALAALLRTVTLENPRIAGQVLAFDGACDGDRVATAVTENARHADDGLVLHRGTERRVRTWTPRTADGTGTPWRPGGVYLITGGAGGIGAVVARRIAQDTDRPRLVLVGRSAQDSRIGRLLSELRESGAVARYAVADVSRWEEVSRLVAGVREEEGPIHGIIHAAGVIHDAYVTDKSARDWDRVLAPKVDGVVHLDRATADMPLESFLLFSSGAAVTGNPGQCDYATANAYLGAYAAHRNARVAAGERSGRTVAIAWPLWKDGGMTVDDATRAYLRRHRGLVPMEADEGIDALLSAWRLGEAGEDQIWVHHGETAKAAPASAPAPASAAPVSASAPASASASTPTTAGAGPDRETLRSVLGLFARVTKLPLHDVDPDRPLDDLALDSVMVVQLNRELSAVYGEVPTTLFYEFPTLRAVAAHLAGRQTPPTPGARTGEPTGEVRAAVRDTVAAPDASGGPLAQHEPIAIIGMSGRYPGARDTDEFWANLSAGRDAVTEIPPGRWPLDGFYEPDRATAVATGRSYSKWGGFLEDFDAFDPHFFRIAPRDAYAMDPQERLFLQASWEVIEDAGYTREELARRHQRRVGVFAGVTKSGHARHGAALLPSGEQVVPALSFASLSARTSYVLDLRGPSLTIDTMCSSSLTAIHEACEHLRQGSCDLAVAGGVNLYLHPSDYVELCRSTMLSSQARVRSFGSGADGFVPGEGVGAVLLKPLARALADGDRVLAVVRGTSINHGGRSNGYTVPSPTAQAELIGDALTRAGVSAREVGYVEAHGTGTELGDPIEVKGLSLAFEEFTRDKQFCAIGSVKSVIGHLEAAAGVAGVTKAVLQLQHRTLVPSLHAEEPNPGIRFEETPFRLQRTLAPWESERPRITAVSSFGAGGSNAHVILEEYVADAVPERAAADEGEQIVVLSARTPEQLRHSAARLAAHLDQDEAEGRTVRLTDLAFTLRSGREAMRERLALTTASLPELRRMLRAYAETGDGTAIPGLHRGSAGQTPGAAAEISADDDLRELLVERWGRSGRRDKLAALWADGMDLDWRRLPAEGSPRRISLPTYPFATDRFWIGDLEPVRGADTTAAPTAAPAAAPAVVEPRSGRPTPHAVPEAVPGGPSDSTRGERVADIVRAKIADVLVMSPDEVEGGLAFADYGLDSILAVRLVHVLNETLGLDLTTGIVFDHSSADRLAAHLLAEYGHIDAPALAPASSPAPVPPSVPARTPAATARTRPRIEPGPPPGGPSLALAPAPAPVPIAVVGMSGRFASSDTLEDLWTHLLNGDDLVTEATRWDLPDTGPDGSARCTRGGFLDGIDRFDPLFFGISGVEAAVMDPQQRLLLEEAWKALEDAGYAGRQLGETRCGVYVGCWNGDYHELVEKNSPAQALWGNMASLIPARVSYLLDLKGPALAVDTACSSSLIAIDLACRGLRSGETDTALAGGVFVQSTPRLYELAGRAGMLSATGRCHTFDHRADGFVPGEGVGVLVLKRLDDAIADGDHIHGVIRATGSNHDGATNGITAPSSVSQESLLRDVHASSGIDAESIQLVEAHGTGTPLGDPIEFSALSRVFRAGTEKTGFCALGSIKSNLGHTQFAAGVAGVFKILLAMRHEQIPASLHFEKPNDAIGLDGSPFYLSTRNHRWEAPSDGGPRRGAVSSFGASGTNAHLVIEEAPPTPRARARTQRPAYLVVLSAHSRGQLAQQLTRLAERIRREDSTDLGDLAYTLTVGRDRFAHRFACVAGDRTELLRILDEGLDGADAFTGRAAPERKGRPGAEKSGGEACLGRCSEFTGSDADAGAYRADLTALAGHFARGADLDYGAVFPAGAHRRVPLPTYPFVRESHWAGPPPVPPLPISPSPAAALAEGPAAMRRPTAGHPLIHRYPAVAEAPGTLRASTVFTGDESVLRDHTVRGQRVLPGVAHLEMAREAAARVWGADATAPLVMRDITWVRPAAAEGGPLSVDVLVKPGEGDQLVFEIASGSEGSGGGGDPVVFSAGRVSRSDAPRPERIDLASLRATCATPVSAERIREALAEMGIVHGPSLRAIREAYVDTGTGTVLAELDLPAEADPADGGYVLHPALLDSAIQSSIALHLTDGPATPETVVPFALDRFELLAPCPASMRAVVRVADEPGTANALSRLDVDVTDADGQVCVRMTGYTSRRLKEPAPSLFAPVWEPVSAHTADEYAPRDTDRVLVVGGTAEQRAALTRRYPRLTTWDLAPSASIDEVTSRLRASGPVGQLLWIAPDMARQDLPPLLPTDTAGFTAAQEGGVIAAFRMIKALVRTGHDARPLGVTLVTRSALATHDTEPTAPAHAGLHGLFGSLGQEYANWSVRRTDLDTAELPEDLLTLPDGPGSGPLVRRAGQWLVRRWAPNDPGDGQRTAYRRGGVYVVIGGAGGLGEQWTRHVVRRYGAHVVWIGRRPQDASIQAKLDAAGGSVRYLSADAADPASLRIAYKEVKRHHPRIHGVIQAALVLRDQSLARMDEATLRASLAAKVDVGVAMAEVFADEELDFALFFSSVQSFTTAAGQSNYAAGCTFSDAYAHFLARHWECPVKVMNWGWWGSVGSVATERHREHMARWGLLSIEPPEAMEALDTLLGGPQRQLSFVKVKDLDAIEALDPATLLTVHDRARSHVAPALVGSAATAPAEWEAMRAIAAWRRDERDPLLARLVRGHLEALGALHGPGTPSSPGDVARLRRRAGILDRYDTWLDHALRVVPASAPSLDELRREWDDRRAHWSTDPDKAAELALLDATLRALPDILTGATRPTDILFPRGSVELVEGTYRDNRVADMYNRAMADAAVSIVAERLRQDPAARLRILEIGAGTGGTSVGMFAALRPFQEHIETYTYTDLSKAFLNHARAAYGPRTPYLSYARFDAEQPLAGQQGVRSGSYDLVVAANVLHATRDTRNTIRNAKAALRDGGWLLLNELATFDVSSHLTFGLLEGWWLFEDHSLRVPGSPALSPGNWRTVLESEGFRTVVPVLPQARELGQQIIAAESDGIARQTVAPSAHRKPAARRAPATPRPPQAPAPAPTPVRVPAQPLDDRGATATPSGVGAGSRSEILTGYLRDRAARTLGIPADRIALSAPLTDYGMDSILVLQLTNALREDLGEVSSTLLFDAESVEELADHFLETGGTAVDALVARLNPSAGEQPVSDSAPRQSAHPLRSIAALFRTVVETGTPQEAGDLLSIAARLRPTFATGAGPEPEIFRLSDGGPEPALVCLPSLIAPTGAHQYMRFAGALRGRRRIWAVSVPGYGTGEPLPENLEAAADRLAETLLRRFEGGAFALAGYSSGGWLAHEVVRRLEAAGAPPAGLVLLDTPRSTGAAMTRGMTVITRRLLDRFPQLPLGDEQVTAMAWYAELLDGWRPLPVTTPTLLAGAAEDGPLLDLLGEDARAGWPLEHLRTEVTGDHFSLLEEHAASTALAVERWLSGIGPSPDGS
ncbi:SDR family NAD(P)-dependent oxidoreductase [Streptomyces sp. NPDC088729]|uniref:SDR family NAD(P)-dependent oxidoreductase n=1 Tax=Streptomyces sp. NPDC088729 TaxID=3365876 RepID=UPI0037F2A860